MTRLLPGLLLFCDVSAAQAREFHRRFYHRVPTEAQLDALLGEPGILPR